MIFLVPAIVAAVVYGVYSATSSMQEICASVNNVATLSGHKPLSQNFLAFGCGGQYTTAEITDTAVNWSQAGLIHVTLELSRDGNTAVQNAYVHVLEPVGYIEIEVGTLPQSILPYNFLYNSHLILENPQSTLFETEILTDLTNITTTVGQHTIELMLNGVRFSSVLHVVDTTPPTASTANITVNMGQPVFAGNFITSLFDHSTPITVQFVNKPDVFLPGEQQVNLLLSDYYGNSAVYAAALTVLPNTVPPTIVGARDLQLIVGSSAMFRFGVSAYDAFGRSIDFTVDSAGVDIWEVGTYYVTYKAEDCCGNYTTVTVRVSVIEVDPEEVRERAAAVLDRILSDEMSQVEQARAIFNWVIANVGYAAGFEHRTVYESANQGLVHRRGDCFVFFSVSEVLLTMAGIPNMRIDRIPGTTSRHVWNLINPDGLGWHHFDTTPLVVRQIDRFMFTQSQAEEFTAIIFAEGQGRDYFTFDPLLYPEIVR
jgi:hypothetical protein